MPKEIVDSSQPILKYWMESKTLKNGIKINIVPIAVNKKN